MKTCIALFSILILSVTSCKKDEDNRLEGNWSMVNAVGGIAGFNQQYPKGQIIWTFDDGTLNVANKYSGQLNFSFPTGSYRYLEINSSNSTTLYINDQQFGDFKISNDSLIIDQSSFIADGFRFTFIRQ